MIPAFPTFLSAWIDTTTSLLYYFVSSTLPVQGGGFPPQPHEQRGEDTLVLPVKTRKAGVGWSFGPYFCFWARSTQVIQHVESLAIFFSFFTCWYHHVHRGKSKETEIHVCAADVRSTDHCLIYNVYKGDLFIRLHLYFFFRTSFREGYYYGGP